MTVALLLGLRGHEVVLVEREQLGGLWACRLDAEGHYQSENSCKVFQPSYTTAPRLFALLGTRWDEHFVARHDLRRDWLQPFIAACTWTDLFKLARAFFASRLSLRDYRQVSVPDWMAENGVSEHCQRWMRATALGGIAGTLRMTMWELFLRIGTNLGSILGRRGSALYWNARPPNAEAGFVSAWRRALREAGVVMRSGVATVIREATREQSRVELADGEHVVADAVFLAVPPPALAKLLSASDATIARGFGHEPAALPGLLSDSKYEHLGIAWFFSEPLPAELPLGGHNVRRHWHAILVQHSQYADHLAPGEKAVVVGSVAVDTALVHERLGKRASDYTPEALAALLWDDERRVDPCLPEPCRVEVHGLSSATQIVQHGALPVRCATAPVYLATSLNGQARYFTASLESAIQAGEAAAVAFDAGASLDVALAARAKEMPSRRSSLALA